MSHEICVPRQVLEGISSLTIQAALFKSKVSKVVHSCGGLNKSVLSSSLHGHD